MKSFWYKNFGKCFVNQQRILPQYCDDKRICLNVPDILSLNICLYVMSDKQYSHKQFVNCKLF